MALVHEVQTYNFGMINEKSKTNKKKKRKNRLQLFNHKYSNMNIPYINENLFAFYDCAKQNIHHID